MGYPPVSIFIVYLLLCSVLSKRSVKKTPIHTALNAAGTRVYSRGSTLLGSPKGNPLCG